MKTWTSKNEIKDLITKKKNINWCDMREKKKVIRNTLMLCFQHNNIIIKISIKWFYLYIKKTPNKVLIDYGFCPGLIMTLFDGLLRCG
jgi:hypothetical protein